MVRLMDIKTYMRYVYRNRGITQYGFLIVNFIGNTYKIVLQVNDIAFHPVHGTLATVGSDGTFSFWDKDARTKLKPSEPMEQPITRCCLNHNGQIFAYAVSYDWSKVSRVINVKDLFYC